MPTSAVGVAATLGRSWMPRWLRLCSAVGPTPSCWRERAEAYELEERAAAVAPGALLERAEEREDPDEKVAFADVGGEGRALGEVEDDGAADASGSLDDLGERRVERRVRSRIQTSWTCLRFEFRRERSEE